MYILNTAKVSVKLTDDGFAVVTRRQDGRRAWVPECVVSLVVAGSEDLGRSLARLEASILRFVS